ncbi:MAG: nuclear transport factor 2 family protein [Chloroflexi bacterium]|nr:nuclear transport factor 2 family protein [Chloroflexota bacterium]
MSAAGDLKGSDVDPLVDVIAEFNTAFRAHDLDAIMQLMTDDCVFENTYPAPGGTRHSGQDEVREAFAQFFQSSPHAEFVTEEMFAAGDRCVVRWTYHWAAQSDQQSFVRGVDIFRIRDSRVAEKLSYVKG